MYNIYNIVYKLNTSLRDTPVVFSQDSHHLLCVEKPSSTDVLLLSRLHQSLIASSKTVVSPCRARTLSTELDFGVALTGALPKVDVQPYRPHDQSVELDVDQPWDGKCLKILSPVEQYQKWTKTGNKTKTTMQSFKTRVRILMKTLLACDVCQILMIGMSIGFVDLQSCCSLLPVSQN